jgi:hypothetical protein
MLKFCVPFLCVLIFSLVDPRSGNAQYAPQKHLELEANEIPIREPGAYDRPGATYRLMNDLSSPRSTLFLGKDVTLDLNGYTLRYADGAYEHIPNSGFEEGERGWDLSHAPGAAVVNTEEVHVFVGKKLLSMKAGDEIVSPYINLPVADRSYFAMCGVTGRDYQDMNGDLKNQMKVSVYVEDANGRNVVCTTAYADTTMVSCPVEKRAPRLGGGVVYAHINKLPAGKYRIRIKAGTDCLVDEIDLRPAMDTGIGIVGKTYPTGHYDHLYNSVPSAFFDYTQNVADSTAIPGIPAVRGEGSVIIRNGIIENGAVGALSFGIQSTAKDVKVILDNVLIKTSGINTIAVDVPQATITHCTFDVNSPFIINRHGSSFYGVDITGPQPSEVSYSDFYGGQGCLVFKGNKSSVHHNHFVNRQMVTNHYSIMAMGDSSKIFSNYIEPEVGSGVEIFRHKFIDIFDNIIKIKTSPPTCEYGHEEYSTAAVRMADYLSKAGDPTGCYGNRVYSNQIFITANDYPKVASYTPMAWAVYYSASAGDNFVFGNEITVEETHPGSKTEAAAFYVCGGPAGYGGQFYNNRITTNVPAAWVASMYGGAANTKIYDNTIIKATSAAGDFKTIRIGHPGCDWCVAKDIEFRSNIIQGDDFDLQVSEEDNSFSVYWTLQGQLKNKKGDAVRNVMVTILDANSQQVTSLASDENGTFRTELMEYSYRDKKKTMLAPYTVIVGKKKTVVPLKGNSQVTIVTQR